MILEEDIKTSFCLLWSELIYTVIYLFYTETFKSLLIKCHYCSEKQQLLGCLFTVESTLEQPWPTNSCLKSRYPREQETAGHPEM